MDSEAAPAVSLSPAQGPPSPPTPSSSSSSSSPSGGGGGGFGVPPLLIRAPLSSPKAAPAAAASSSSSSSSTDSSEAFLSGEDDPEFETASERPFVAEPDEDNLELAPDSEGSSSDGEDLPPPPPPLPRKPVASAVTAMPKARVSWEDEDVPEEEEEEEEEEEDVVDAGEADASPALVVRVPPSDEGVGSPGSLEGDDDGVLEDGNDDKEEEPSPPEVRVSKGAGEGVPAENPKPGVNSGDGVSGSEEKATVEGGGGSVETTQDGVPWEVSKDEALPENPPDGGEASKDNTLPENPVAATELSASVGSGIRVVAAGEEDGVSNPGVEKDVDLAGGSEEAIGAVTDLVGDIEPVEAQSDLRGVEEKEVSDVQGGKEEGLVSEPEEAGSSVTEFAVEANATEAESDSAANETGGTGGAGFDKAGEISTVPAISLSEEATSPVTEVAMEAKVAEAESEAPINKSGGAGDVVSDQIVEPSTTPVVEAPGLQSFDTIKSVGETEKDEVLYSSATRQMIGEVEEDIALKEVAVPADSGEAEDSAHWHGDENKSVAVDESVPLKLGPKDRVDEEEEASSELKAKSTEAEPKIETDGGDENLFEDIEFAAQTTKGSQNEEANKEALGVSAVADDGNVRVVYLSPSELKDNGGSQTVDDDENMDLSEAEEDDDEEGLVSHGPAKVAILGSSETVKQLLRELEEGSSGGSSGFGRSRDYSHQIDGQIVSDSDEEVETDEEGDGKELFDSAALAALLKAATGASPDGSITISGPDASRIFSADRPAGLGSSAPSLKPTAPRQNRPSLFSPSDLAVMGEPENNIDEEEKKLQEKVEQIRVKFLRLVHRLGHSPEDTVAAQVLYRLGLAEGIRRGRQIGRSFSLENAKKKALQLEEDGKVPLDFSCNILVLGKSGVGKSATINSIFGEQKVHTDAFVSATVSVKEITGIVDGVHIRVIDTPGLRSSVMDQTANKRILSSIKKYTKKCPPDIVLYVDRLDTQTRDFNDMPLLRSIASTLGSSIWFNAIIALTHAASAPPDGPNGSTLSYEVFIAQRSHVVQHSICQAAGDMRLMNPVALVENHPSCRRNREGKRVLPNGLSWRTQMLLLCYSSKILSEANSLLKLQDPSPAKLFGFRVRSPPLPFLLSSLLQSRAHPKLATDQGNENGDSDIDLGDLSDSDQEEEEDEYDQLPPFKPLGKAQLAQLTKEQRKAYFDEYDYRVKLLQKKQWKEELRRLKDMKKRGKGGQDESGYGDMAEDYDQDVAPAAVPVPLPDMVLPPSFDCDNPAYRYRFLEPTSQLLARPVLDTHGWDHDCGYDGVSLEENLAIAGQFPAGIAVQITKDKKEFNIHLDSSVSAKHGENGSTLAGFDIQSVGKQLAYILRSETKFKNLKKNKTAAGISVTFLGENIATGLKLEDQLLIGKRVSLVASTGAVRAQGDVAYGANFEARLREKDFPIGQDLSTLGLSLMRWRGDLALGANLQSQFSVGRNSKMAVRIGLNNKLSGQITVRTSSSEQLQIALLGIIPIVASIYRSIWPGETYIGH